MRWLIATVVLFASSGCERDAALPAIAGTDLARYSPFAGDFDGDGLVDLAIASEDVAVTIALKGGGWLAPLVGRSGANDPVLGDWNGDGAVAR